jgi:hypothetical protein
MRILGDYWSSSIGDGDFRGIDHSASNASIMRTQLLVSANDWNSVVHQFLREHLAQVRLK